MKEPPASASSGSSLARGTLVVISLILFVVALFFPVYCIRVTGGRSHCVFGIGFFLFDWLQFLSPGDGLFLPWLANLFYFGSLRATSKRRMRKGVFCSLIALLFGGWFLCVSEYTPFILYNMDPRGSRLPEIKLTLGSGYFIWMSSIFLAFFSTFADPAWDVPSIAPGPEQKNG